MTNTLTHDLRVISWNAQSLFPKSHEIIDYFETHVYDIICFCETWLDCCQKLIFPSYKLYRVDRQAGGGGGVAIAVNRSLKHTQLSSLTTKAIESVAVSVETPAGPITFVSVYFPGTDLSPSNMAAFKSDIKALTSMRNSYFACGDLNSKHRLWNNVRGNQAGNIIFDELNYRPFMVFNSPTPTCFPSQTGRKPSNIDIVLSNHFHGNTQVIPNHDLMSDHCAVEFTVTCTVSRVSGVTKRFNFERGDWDKFKQTVDASIDLNGVNLSTCDEIDVEVEKFTKLVLLRSGLQKSAT